MDKIWLFSECNHDVARILKEDLDLPQVVADILAQRGVNNSLEAVDFLLPSLMNLSSPFCFAQMTKAVDRLKLAHNRGEKVLVYGDYDVDGVTSTALTYKVLVDLGFQAVAYIPHRQDEGYGLNDEAIHKAHRAGVKIIITVDCGISAKAEIALANQLGIEVIVTDHHMPPSELPDALVLLNPKLPDSGYPFTELAGVGVAFKLAQALLQSWEIAGPEVITEQALTDLVALGTIADIVPLIGENRILVAHGLKQMEDTVHPGLAELLNECGLTGKALKAGQIGFMVAPRINAAGRMDTARLGLELLLTEDRERGKELARTLTQENALRQQTEQRILAEAVTMLEQNPIPRVIVLSSAQWHHGVIGIVASRLVDRYHRPVFLIGEEGEESKGSARGIPGYHVLEQLTVQKSLLTKYGGHRQAAGFSLPTGNIPLLARALNAAVKDWSDEEFLEQIMVDQEIKFDDISFQLLQYFDQLTPFGFGNANPVLAGLGYPVKEWAALGKDGSHLRITFGQPGRQGEWKGVAFRQGERLAALRNLIKADALFSLERNSYQGREELQLMVKEILPQATWKKKQDHEGITDLARMERETAQREIAAAKEKATPSFLWWDWRPGDRASWIERAVTLQHEGSNFLVWDCRELYQPYQTLGIYAPDAALKQEPGDDFSIGVIAALPLTKEELKMGIEIMAARGISHFVLANPEEDDETIRKRCGFLPREELIQAYRFLHDLVKPDLFNFSFTEALEKSTIRFETEDWREALKLFEELGFLKCLGGSDPLVIRWIPAKQKMDLTSALRYKARYRRFARAMELRRELAQLPVDSLADYLGI